MTYIDYNFKGEPPLEGWTCPTCGQKSWWVMKCSNCGAVFCKHCQPKNFKCNAWYKNNPVFKTEDFDPATAEYETNVEVGCTCGTESTLFIE